MDWGVLTSLRLITIAIMNISHRGWVRFAQSQHKGIGNEAMVQERERGRMDEEPLIRIVDPMKLCQRAKEEGKRDLLV